MASTPDSPSSDYQAMLPYWDMVDRILDGADAMRKAKDYLPQFPNESDPDYEYRLRNAKFTSIFGDITDDLAAKPFAEPVTLVEGASERVKALANDIDGRGNNLHTYASTFFYKGVAYAIDWTLVEFSRARPRADGKPLSLKDEEAQGLRPYCVNIPAKSMVAVYSATIAGQEQFVHVRMRECTTERDGYDETTVERVRILNREPIADEFGRVVDYAPATFEVWRKDSTSGNWSLEDSGPITIGVIALVPFITGRRKAGSWRMIPPLKRVAELQIEHFQQETALKSIKELTAFPMLAGNGVSAPIENGNIVPAPVGPKTVLYAPPIGDNAQHGEWKFIEPSAESLKFLADEVKTTESQMRELGRQPLTAQTGNLTVVTTAFAAQKGNSAVQAWALNLQDALDLIFYYIALWLKEPTPATTRVFTDFALDMQDDKGPDLLQKMRENGDLSRRTLWSEARRRNILSADFDPDDEEQALEDEIPEVDDEEGLTGSLPPSKPANAA